MAWTTPKTDFANGDVLTAAEMNAVGTDLQYLYDNDPNAVITTKGDMIGGNASGDAARFAVGSNDQVLVADSSASTGLAWKSYGAQQVAGKNKVLNGDFSIWQRGATFTNINADATYTADRFYVTRGGAINVTKRSIGSYNPPQGFGSYAEIVNQSAGNPFLSIEQAVETLNADALADKQVTLSLYARAHANTTASKTLTVRIWYSTSVDTRGGTVLVSTDVSLAYGTAATDWQRFTLSATIPANARSVTFAAVQASTLAVGDGLHITGVQLEVGSVATPFTTATGNPASELAACQRYYYRTVATSQFGAVTPVAWAYSSVYSYTTLTLPVTMRTTPSSVDYSNICFIRYDETTYALTNVAIQGLQSNAQFVAIYGTISGGTAGNVGKWAGNNSSAGYLGVSAEL